MKQKKNYKFEAVKDSKGFIVQTGYEIVIEQEFRNDELVTSSSRSKLLSASECKKLAVKLGMRYKASRKSYTFTTDSKLKVTEGYVTQDHKFIRQCKSKDLLRLSKPK